MGKSALAGLRITENMKNEKTKLTVAMTKSLRLRLQEERERVEKKTGLAVSLTQIASLAIERGLVNQ